MPTIDLDTCTALDVIARAIALHPDLFAARLEAQGRQHEEYAATLAPVHLAKAGASAMARHCRIAVGAIRSGGKGGEMASARIIASETGTLVIALNVACDLQDVPRHMRTALLVRHEVARA